MKRNYSSFLFYSGVTCCFLISFFVIFFHMTFGWIITGWDPFNQLIHDYWSKSALISIILFISGLITFLTAHILVFRSVNSFKSYISVYVLLSGFLGLYGLFYGLIGSISPSYIDIGTFTNRIPIWGAYIGIFLILILFGFYIAWCNPIPQNNEELKTWCDYATKKMVPWHKWLIIYILFYLLGSILFFSFLVLSDQFFPNIFTSYYYEPEVFKRLQETLIFFPGLFLHTISFLFYYWSLIRIKIKLFLIKHRFENQNKKIPFPDT